MHSLAPKHHDDILRWDGLLFTRESAAVLIDVTDSEGNPLWAEGYLDDAVHSPRTKRCPYAGSRQGQPMNVAALKAMLPHWDSMMRALSTLGERWGPRDWWDARRTSQALLCVLPFVVQRRDQPLRDGDAPPFLGGLAKAIFDVESSLDLLMIGRVCGGDASSLDALPDPAALLGNLEDMSLLVGRRGVCAGPPQLIVECLRNVFGTGDPPTWDERLDELLNDRGAFNRYVDAMSQLTLLQAATAAIVAPLAQAAEVAVGRSGAGHRWGLCSTLPPELGLATLEQLVLRHVDHGELVGALRALARFLWMDGADSSDPVLGYLAAVEESAGAFRVFAPERLAAFVEGMPGERRRAVVLVSSALGIDLLAERALGEHGPAMAVGLGWRAIEAPTAAAVRTFVEVDVAPVLAARAGLELRRIDGRWSLRDGDRVLDSDAAMP